MNKLQRVELLKDLIQEAVDKGATSVEQVHQYIADLPFEALEKAGLLRDDRLGLRARQRRSIGMVYDAIRRINREIGQLLSDQFETLEDSAQAARNLRRGRRRTRR
jgi:polyhydroxyalkanoate synthesis regulator phasin